MQRRRHTASGEEVHNEAYPYLVYVTVAADIRVIERLDY